MNLDLILKLLPLLPLIATTARDVQILLDDPHFKKVVQEVVELTTELEKLGLK